MYLWGCHLSEKICHQLPFRRQYWTIIIIVHSEINQITILFCFVAKIFCKLSTDFVATFCVAMNDEAVTSLSIEERKTSSRL